MKVLWSRCVLTPLRFEVKKSFIIEGKYITANNEILSQRSFIKVLFGIRTVL